MSLSFINNSLPGAECNFRLKPYLSEIIIMFKLIYGKLSDLFLYFKKILYKINTKYKDQYAIRENKYKIVYALDNFSAHKKLTYLQYPAYPIC